MLTREAIPHPIPYQGSKRLLAPRILWHAPKRVRTLYEPFAGSAALSLYAAYHDRADRFVIGDSLDELISLWRKIIASPKETADEYEALWRGQTPGEQFYFNEIRAEFNEDRDPVKLLYLMARCVKNAIRFNAEGRFTQSVDKRRLGMNPVKMRQQMIGASRLLDGRIETFSGDFHECVARSSNNDLVYMDPPYQGTTYGRDKRYFAQLKREVLYVTLRTLNDKNVGFLLSYDGMSGDKVYGEDLPPDIQAKRIFLEAGRSSQATLSGRRDMTVESLYISCNLNGDKQYARELPLQYALAL